MEAAVGVPGGDGAGGAATEAEAEVVEVEVEVEVVEEEEAEEVVNEREEREDGARPTTVSAASSCLHSGLDSLIIEP